mmetsp:Transcript_48613/g.105399  ORF Transcript_48613/g.105399 Transcript_48613/m.105399 type:complete len:211 (+) Transcript_48613:1283-1915(+)
MSVRAASYRLGTQLLRLELALGRPSRQQHHRLALRRAKLPQLQRAILGAAHERVAVRTPRRARHARLDASFILHDADAGLPALHVERHGVVASLERDRHVPQPHRAILAAGGEDVAVVHVPARAGGCGDVALGVAHVTNVHVALHQRAELAPVAVENHRLVVAARDDQRVRCGAVVDRSKLHLPERLLYATKRTELLRHSGKVPKEDVVV